jgi:hypothetical protein
MGPSLSSFLESSNVVLTIIFALEMVAVNSVRELTT